MAEFRSTDTRVVAASGTATKAEFGGPPLDAVYVYADTADAGVVYIDFDQSPDTSTSHRLQGKVNIEFDLPCNTVYLLTDGTSVNVYLLGVRRN